MPRKSSNRSDSSKNHNLSVKRSQNNTKGHCVRCKTCNACLRKNCGKCNNCLDMPTFGGQGRLKKACVTRQCMMPVTPQTREKQQITLCEVQWLNCKVTVHQEKVRAFLLSAEEIENEIDKVASLDAKIGLYERLLLDCEVALEAVEDDMKSDKHISKPKASSLSLLRSYMIYIRLEKTVKRYLLIIESLKRDIKSKSRPANEVKKQSNCKDLVLAYEIIIQNLQEVTKLPDVDEDPSLIDITKCKILAFKAHKLYYIADIYASDSEWSEAMALYGLADDYAKQCLVNKSVISKELFSSVVKLRVWIKRERYNAYCSNILVVDETCSDESKHMPGEKRGSENLYVGECQGNRVEPKKPKLALRSQKTEERSRTNLSILPATKLRKYQDIDPLTVPVQHAEEVSQEDIRVLIQSGKSYCENKAFWSFKFLPWSLTDTEAAKAVICMFEDLGMTRKWRIDKLVLAKFVLCVKNSYNDLPFHSFQHAFAVAHFCYVVLKTHLVPENWLSDLERLALLVAALCHDLNHGGTSNQFQISTGSVLAALHGPNGSILEEHHYAECIRIIYTEGANILSNVSMQEHQEILVRIKSIILSTDVGQHALVLKDVNDIHKVGYNIENPHHHDNLLKLITICADFSDQVKGWMHVKHIAKLIFYEFYKEGDLLVEAGMKPDSMMDRTISCIPQIEIDFLNNLVLPPFKLLAKFLPDATFLVHAIEKNKYKWQRVYVLYKRHYKSFPSSLEFLDDEEVDEAALTI